MNLLGEPPSAIRAKPGTRRLECLCETHESSRPCCSQHHEARSEEPKGCARESAEVAIAQVVAAHTRNLKCVLHEIDFHAPPQALTTRSISTQAPSGSTAACKSSASGTIGNRYGN